MQTEDAPFGMLLIYPTRLQKQAICETYTEMLLHSACFV